jgi:hypothetical protein
MIILTAGNVIALPEAGGSREGAANRRVRIYVITYRSAPP